MVRPLSMAAGLAVVVGGVWYLRNIAQHGWPLWPFSSAPWGDPRPPIIANADVKFIDRPGDTLSRLGDYYLHHFGGPLLVFCGAVAAALVARSRAVALAAAAALVSMFIWMNAPFTGVFGATRAFDIGTGDATRYLLPGAACGAGGGAREPARRLAAGGVRAAPRRGGGDRGAPDVRARLPERAVAGDARGGDGARRGRGVRDRARAAAAGAVMGAARGRVAALLAAAAFGAVAANGFVERHGETGTRESPLAALVRGAAGLARRRRPVASTWSLVGTTAGDRLQHPLVLVGALEACARGRSAGWLVVDRNEARLRGARGCGVPPGYSDHDFQAYGPLQLRGRIASKVPAP